MANLYPPSPDFVHHAHVQGMEGYRELYQKAAENPEEFWGEPGRNGAPLVSKVVPRLRVASALRQVVRGRQDQRLLQLPRPPSRHPSQEQGRHSLGGRARRPAHDLLPGTAPPGLPLRQRAQGPRPQGRRPRHHLHGHGARAARRAAGLRAPRHHPQRRLRRILGRGPQGAHPGSGSAGGHHLPMAPGAAARRSASRTPSTRPWPIAPASATSSSTAAPAARSTCSRAATTGGTSSTQAAGEDLPRRAAR